MEREIGYFYGAIACYVVDASHNVKGKYGLSGVEISWTQNQI